MHAYRISNVVPQGRQIIINLPPDLEADSFNITLEPNVQPAELPQINDEQREYDRALLFDAGMSPNQPLSAEERANLEAWRAERDRLRALLKSNGHLVDTEAVDWLLPEEQEELEAFEDDEDEDEDTIALPPGSPTTLEVLDWVRGPK